MGLDLARDLEYKKNSRRSDVEAGFAGVAEG